MEGSSSRRPGSAGSAGPAGPAADNGAAATVPSQASAWDVRKAMDKLGVTHLRNLSIAMHSSDDQQLKVTTTQDEIKHTLDYLLKNLAPFNDNGCSVLKEWSVKLDEFQSIVACRVVLGEELNNWHRTLVSVFQDQFYEHVICVHRDRMNYMQVPRTIKQEHDEHDVNRLQDDNASLRHENHQLEQTCLDLAKKITVLKSKIQELTKELKQQQQDAAGKKPANFVDLVESSDDDTSASAAARASAAPAPAAARAQAPAAARAQAPAAARTPAPAPAAARTPAPAPAAARTPAPAPAAARTPAPAPAAACKKVWHDGEWHVQVKDLISKVQEMFTRPDDISLRATAFADLPCEQGKEILERLLRDKRCCPHKTGLERWLDKEANKLTKPQAQQQAPEKSVRFAVSADSSGAAASGSFGAAASGSFGAAASGSFGAAASGKTGAAAAGSIGAAANQPQVLYDEKARDDCKACESVPEDWPKIIESKASFDPCRAWFDEHQKWHPKIAELIKNGFSAMWADELDEGLLRQMQRTSCDVVLKIVEEWPDKSQRERTFTPNRHVRFALAKLHRLYEFVQSSEDEGDTESDSEDSEEEQREPTQEQKRDSTPAYGDESDSEAGAPRGQQAPRGKQVPAGAASGQQVQAGAPFQWEEFEPRTAVSSDESVSNFRDDIMQLDMFPGPTEGQSQDDALKKGVGEFAQFLSDHRDRVFTMLQKACAGDKTDLATLDIFKGLQFVLKEIDQVLYEESRKTKNPYMRVWQLHFDPRYNIKSVVNLMLGSDKEQPTPEQQHVRHWMQQFKLKLAAM